MAVTIAEARRRRRAVFFSLLTAWVLAVALGAGQSRGAHDAPFANAIFDEPRAANTTRDPFYRRHLSATDQARATQAAMGRDSPGGIPATGRADSWLAELRTSYVFFDTMAGRFTNRWADRVDMSLKGVVSSMVSQHFYEERGSRATVADITRAWPYFFHYKDFLTQERRMVHRRVYQGVVDVDFSTFDLLTGVKELKPTVTTPREALVVVYNDWDSGAMESLAVLERFARQHTRERGARIYTELDWSNLRSAVANLLVRSGRQRGEVLEAPPDGFFRLMQHAYPEDGVISLHDNEDTSTSSSPSSLSEAGAMAPPLYVYWLDDATSTRFNTAGKRADGGEEEVPHVTGVPQMVGALRLASFPTDPADHRSTLFAATPSPQFVLLGAGGLEQAPRLAPASPAGVTPLDLQKFVLRHSCSSLFIRTYEQVARLVADYGRIAILTVPADYAAALRGSEPASRQALLQEVAQLPTVAALRRLVPAFVLWPAADAPPPPDWWLGVPTVSVEALDVGKLLAPLPAMTRDVDAVRRAVAGYGKTATLSVLEAAQQPLPGEASRRNVSGRPPLPTATTPWVRHDVVVPLVSPADGATTLRAHEMLVGSLVVDAVAALEARRAVVVVDGSNFQHRLHDLRGERNKRAAHKPDVVVVFDEGVDDAGGEGATTCGERVRAFVNARRADTAAGEQAKFMIVNARERDFSEELLRAAWPLPASGVNATGAAMCPTAHPAAEGPDLRGCTVLCVPGSDKALYRLQPPILLDAEDRPSTLESDSRPLEHPTRTQLREATLELANAVGPPDDTADGDDVPEMFTRWSTTEHMKLPWRLLLPEGFAMPLLEFNLSGYGPSREASEAESTAHLLLLTDSACAQCATLAKVVRLLKGCIPPIVTHLYELDVVQLLRAPAAEQARLLYSARTRAEMPFALVGPSFLVGASAASQLRPPRIVVQRGDRVLMTLPSLAYYDRVPWPRAVLEIAGTVFGKEGERGRFPGSDAVLRCVDDVMAAERDGKAKFRRGAQVQE